ncbi:MAG: accessory Sec system protein Asp2 [Schleiferilactobacillus perolens]|uniref:accessory Sec system protein Asp2 n=1 Tax=Schleiferilactobacillus perolens TaxID=100468 RepID=UPI0039EBFA9E
MSERTRYIIHIGAQALPDLEAKLPKAEQYVHLTEPTDTIVVDSEEDPLPLFGKRGLQSVFRNALFLLDKTATILDQPDLLTQLPANGIVLDEKITLTGEAADVLKLKQAVILNIFDTKSLADHIVHDWFGGQEGLKIDPDSVTVAPSFHGTIQQTGHVEVAYTGQFGDEWTPLIYWRMTAWLIHDRYLHFWPECTYSAQTADIRFVVTMMDMQTGEVTQTITLDGKDADQGVTFFSTEKDQVFGVQMLAKGHGTIHLGQLHLRHARRQYGVMFQGGQRLTTADPLNSELMVYFDAGDLKPPLNVYFSGYRTAEGFEGNFMMQTLGAPFLLICDSRLEGGGFYYGNEELEQAVKKTIQQTLQRLQFRPDQLILSGISMGTTPALYYGAQIKPRGIIVGKPLVNVGSIAENARIRRPNDFETALDVVLAQEGNTTPTSAETLNQRFWNVFKQGDFTKTTIAIAYMLQDDYDREAFPDMYQYLTGGEKNVRLLHKGRIGRHNDDTTGVINWFLQQYKLILSDQFGRTFEQGASE